MHHLPVAVLTLACFLGTPVAAESRPWTIQDAVSVETMNDVQLSPDGAYALVGLARADAAANTFATGYQRIAINGGRSLTMPSNLCGPRWRPDGTTIAWLRATKKGLRQIVLKNDRGGALRVLTTGPRSVVAYAWSPDGRHIAAVETSPTGSTSATRMRWMTPESDYRDSDQPRREIFILDAVTGTERLLTHDSWSYGGPVTDHDPSWSADGTKIAVVRQPEPVYGDFERAQYVTVDTSDGTIAQIVDHPFFAYPASAPPVFAPSGDTLAYTHTWDGKLPSREDVYVGDRDVSKSLDRDLWSCGAGRIVWQPRMLVADLMDGVAQRLYKIDEDGSAPQALTPLGGSVQAFSVAPTGRIAYAWSTPEAPADLYVLDPGHAPRRVTHFGVLGDLPIATTRLLTWQSADDHTLHGQLTVPSGVSAATPLVLEPHGGPQCADDAAFFGFAQYLATHGYAYFRPDPRGSDGYGDWSYKAIVDNWGEGPMADDLTGIDAAFASGVGNPRQLYIEGGSYGGYLTSWIVTHSDRFRAAVAQIPVDNILTEYTLSESPNIVRRFFGAKPALDQALLARESPLTYAKDEHTPLLVMIGLLDKTAPYTQAIEFYKTVAEHGTDARLLADANAAHGPDDPQGIVLWMQATLAWLVAHGAPALPGAVMPK